MRPIPPVEAVRYRLTPKVNPAEIAKRGNVVQRILAGLIGQIEPVGDQVHPKHPLHASGRAAGPAKTGGFFGFLERKAA